MNAGEERAFQIRPQTVDTVIYIKTKELCNKFVEYFAAALVGSP